MQNNRKHPYVDSLELGLSDGYPEWIRPHTALWGSVLFRGIQDFCWCRKEASLQEQGRKTKTRALGQTTSDYEFLKSEVEAWFWGDSTAVASLAWICDALSLDATRLRNEVLSKWRNYARAPKPETPEAPAASAKPRKGANRHPDGPALRLRRTTSRSSAASPKRNEGAAQPRDRRAVADPVLL